MFVAFWELFCKYCFMADAGISDIEVSLLLRDDMQMTDPNSAITREAT
jgi:hypothetical protein